MFFYLQIAYPLFKKIYLHKKKQQQQNECMIFIYARAASLALITVQVKHLVTASLNLFDSIL